MIAGSFLLGRYWIVNVLPGRLRRRKNVVEAQDVDWTFLRPAMIRGRPSEGQVVSSPSMSGPVNFVDLAKFHLDTAGQGTHVRELPWVTYGEPAGA